MLHKLRIVIAVVLYVAITLSLLGITRMAWAAHIQFLPALLSLNVGILIFLILLTVITGRTYCSVICPAGVLQDIIDKVSRWVHHKKTNHYSKPKNILRYSVLGIAIVGFVMQLFYVPAVLDPYSSYGRVVTQLVKPLWLGIKNWLVPYNEMTGWWLIHEDFLAQSYAATILAVAWLFVIAIFAWLFGRTFCNTICPVGTILGTISRYSFLKVRIDTAKCNHCGLCARRCKASCINSKNSTIDYSRCVVCFDCLEQCKRGALSFGWRNDKKDAISGENKAEENKTKADKMQDVVKNTTQGDKTSENRNALSDVDTSRRQFLTTALGVIAAAPLAKAQQVYETTQGEKWERHITCTMDGKVVVKRFWALMPPGTVSRDRFQSRCTSCGLCISSCPQHILKPAVREYGIEGIMQPTVSFENGFCKPDCNVCGQVCPTGAIKPLPLPEKRKDKLGWANYNSKTCITQTDDVDCGICASHCPNKAIKLVEKNGRKVPKVIVSLCVGCGACEYYCPARPKAIYVEGLMY